MLNKVTALALSLVIALCGITTACSPIENNARDAAAGLNGALTAAITKYTDTCTKTNPNAPVCNVLRSGVAGQNALVTSVETYCGWSVAAPPTDPLTKCKPVATAKAGLIAAIANANQLTLEIKAAIQ